MIQNNKENSNNNNNNNINLKTSVNPKFLFLRCFICIADSLSLSCSYSHTHTHVYFHKYVSVAWIAQYKANKCDWNGNRKKYIYYNIIFEDIILVFRVPKGNKERQRDVHKIREEKTHTHTSKSYRKTERERETLNSEKKMVVGTVW